MTSDAPPTGLEPRGGVHPGRAERSWIPRVATVVVLALAVHLLLPAVAGFGETRQALQQLSGDLVALAALAQIGSYIGSGLLLQGLVRIGGGTISLTRGAAITLASGAVGTVAAGIVGSTISLYRWVHQDAGAERGAWVAAGLKPVFNVVVLAALGGIGLVRLILDGEVPRHERSMLEFLLVLVVLALGAASWLATHRGAASGALWALHQRWALLRGRRPDHGMVERTIRRAADMWSRVRTGRWKKPLLGAALNVGLDLVCLFLLLLAAGMRIPLGTLLAGYSLPVLLGKVSPVPAGMGVVEVTMAASFVYLGSAGGPVTAVVLVYRLLAFWVPTLIGFVLAAKLQREHRWDPAAPGRHDPPGP